MTDTIRPTTASTYRSKRASRQDRPALAWEALGLAEFPIVTTSIKRPPLDTMEFEETTVRNGVNRRRAWAMVGSAEYGLPRLYDLDLYIAINILAERHGYEARLIKTTIHELCTIPGLTPGGATYDRIKAGVRRFIHTGYSARGVFRADDSKEPIEVEDWRILAEARLLSSIKDAAIKDGLPGSYILLGEKFLAILKRERRKPLDLTVWQQLGSGIAKPLYHYLDTSLYRRDRFEIGLNRLGNHIGQATRYAPSQAVRLYTPHLKRFVDLGFLSTFRFERSRSADDPYKVVVFPGEKARRRPAIEFRVPNYQNRDERPAAARVGRNSGHMEAVRGASEVVLRQRYDEWCADELDRRFAALPVARREELVQAALAGLSKGRHGERLASCPDYFRRRMAENKARRQLAEHLPSFAVWKVTPARRTDPVAG